MKTPHWLNAALIGLMLGTVLPPPVADARPREQVRARAKARLAARRMAARDSWAVLAREGSSRRVRLALRAARHHRFRKMLRQLRNGDLVLRQDILATDLSDARLLRVQALGFRILRDEHLEGLDQRMTVLQPAEDSDIEAALAALRTDDPAGSYDYNHVMDGSSSFSVAAASGMAIAAPAGAPSGVRIGLIDSGVEVEAVALAAARIITRGFATDAEVMPDAHGTAIASLLVGQARNLQGLLPGATLYAADVYGDAADGGSAAAVLRALGWMAAEQVPVINISLVGPRNRAVEMAITRLTARGHVIVAAVGNDGPAAPPLYPAAYAGVIGVTGVDAAKHVLLEANQGAQVTFAARGADVRVSDPDGQIVTVRGTSFAAPVVAAQAAQGMLRPDPVSADQWLRRLQARAIDLGPKGRDSIYGFGYVADRITATGRSPAGMK